MADYSFRRDMGRREGLEMAWIKLDDKRAFHRKFRRQGFEVRGLDEAAICWCAHEETDGFVSDVGLEDIAHHHGVPMKRTLALAGQLVEMTRWERDDKRTGWIIVGYLTRNPSRAELDVQREAKRRAGRVGGLQSGLTRRAQREAPASPLHEAGASAIIEALASPSGSPPGEASA